MEEREMEYVLTNTKFMEWVLAKLKEHYYVDDHTEYDDNNMFYAKKLKCLYGLIAEYARNNSIVPDKSSQYEMYYVNYNDNIFMVYGSGKSYGCLNNTLDRKHVPYCISFEDVRKCKIAELINEEKGIFSDLKKEITRLYNKGVSLEFISQVVNKMLFEVKSEDKGHSYKKI